MKSTKKIISLLSFFCISILSSCAKDYEIGNFYTLREAFSKKYINHQDLLNIAYYYNGEKNINEDFEVKEININDLDEYTMNSIIHTHYESMKDEYDYLKIPVEEIEIAKYYGTYNEAVCVVISGTVSCDLLTYEEYIIDDVKFINFVNGYPVGLEVWVRNL